MSETQEAKIPISVIRRLPKYLMMAKQLHADGVEWVSSDALAEALALTSSTVRQDISHIDFQGISKKGYSTAGLESVLTLTLGADQESVCVVIGAGNLGRALATHEEFARQGFRICEVFDNNPAVIGETIGRFVVRDVSELPSVVEVQKAEIGIVAVPHDAAQSVADRLCKAGIRGVLNLTTAHISVPAGVALVDARIIASLRELAYVLKVNERNDLK
ncbi:MAG: redox-sensing transcriptional repressor Rex [bacterium]|jgi:redox-sensing transcriptional repressor